MGQTEIAAATETKPAAEAGPADGAPQPARETWWQSKIVITILGALAAAVAPVTSAINRSAELKLTYAQKDRELELARAQKDRELALAQKQQNEKVQMEYLSLAIDKKNHDAEERAQVLRFLEVALKDEAIGAWATAERARTEQQLTLTIRDKDAEASTQTAQLVEVQRQLVKLSRAGARPVRGERDQLERRAEELRVKIAKADVDVNRISTEVVRTPPSAGAPANAAPDGVVGPGILRRVVARNLNQARECYEKNIAKSPDATGRVILQFTVGADGSVTQARVQDSSFEGDEMSRCLVAVVKGLTFPTMPGGRPTTIVFPFDFRSP